MSKEKKIKSSKNKKGTFNTLNVKPVSDIEGTKSQESKEKPKYKIGEWGDEEIEILRGNYPYGGTKKCQEKGLNRSVYSIRNKAYKLKLQALNGNDSWTEEEIQLLEEHYPNGGVEEVKKAGVSRRKESILSKAKELGLISYTYWTEEDIEILKNHYHKGVDYVISMGISKSRGAIKYKANSLGLKVDKNYVTWTDTEIGIMVDKYKLGGALLVQLSGVYKSRRRIDAKAKELGVSRYGSNSLGSNGWSRQDTDILMNYYIIGGYTLCKDKGIRKSKINCMAKAEQLSLRRWSDEELSILRDNIDVSDRDKLNSLGIQRTYSEINIVRKLIKDLDNE